MYVKVDIYDVRSRFGVRCRFLGRNPLRFGVQSVGDADLRVQSVCRNIRVLDYQGIARMMLSDYRTDQDSNEQRNDETGTFCLHGQYLSFAGW